MTFLCRLARSQNSLVNIQLLIKIIRLSPGPLCPVTYCLACGPTGHACAAPAHGAPWVMPMRPCGLSTGVRPSGADVPYLLSRAIGRGGIPIHRAQITRTTGLLNASWHPWHLNKPRLVWPLGGCRAARACLFVFRARAAAATAVNIKTTPALLRACDCGCYIAPAGNTLHLGQGGWAKRKCIMRTAKSRCIQALPMAKPLQ